MVQQMMYPNRRSFLGGVAAIAGLAATAHGFAHVERGGGRPFSRQTVLDEARGLAGRPYEPPAPVDSRLTGLDYDSYRQIRYRKDKAIWGGSPTRFSVELFAPGFLFESGVDLFIVENGLSLPVDVGPDSFDVPDPALGALLALRCTWRQLKRANRRRDAGRVENGSSLRSKRRFLKDFICFVVDYE